LTWRAGNKIAPLNCPLLVVDCSLEQVQHIWSTHYPRKWELPVGEMSHAKDLPMGNNMGSVVYVYK